MEAVLNLNKNGGPNHGIYDGCCNHRCHVSSSNRFIFIIASEKPNFAINDKFSQVYVSQLISM
jgi:hypothetical protein